RSGGPLSSAEVSIRIVTQSAGRQPMPHAAKLSTHPLDVERGRVSRLTIEEPLHLWIALEPPASLPVMSDPSKPFRTDRPNDIHPPRNRGPRGAESAGDRGPGKRVLSEVDDPIVELRPGVVLRADVHRVVVVEEMKGKRQHPVCPLVLEIERRRPAEGRKERIPGECPRRQIDEPFRQLERL